MRVTIESIFVTASSSAATFSSSTIVIPARANSGRRYFKLFVSVGTSTYVSPILVAVVKRLRRSQHRLAPVPLAALQGQDRAERDRLVRAAPHGGARDRHAARARPSDQAAGAGARAGRSRRRNGGRRRERHGTKVERNRRVLPARGPQHQEEDDDRRPASARRGALTGASGTPSGDTHVFEFDARPGPTFHARAIRSASPIGYHGLSRVFVSAMRYLVTGATGFL